jgi:2',3'-cyclic-nucleotide 2'-phosphodiesterase (5'-nucleotidase family)
MGLRRSATSLFVCCLAVDALAADTNFSLRLLVSGNIHGAIMPRDSVTKQVCSVAQANSSSCVGGAARRASFVQRVRREAENVMLLDTGASYFGSLTSKVFGGGPTQAIMNLMEYDVIGLCPDDFHDGAPTLASFLGGLRPSISVVATNLNVSACSHLSSQRPGTDVATLVPWAVKSVNGRNVGVISMTDADLHIISFGAKNVSVNTAGYLNQSVCQSTSDRQLHVGLSELIVQRAIRELQTAHPDVNIIIAIAHPHYAEMLTQYTSGIDAVVFAKTGRTNVLDSLTVSNSFGETVGTLDGDFQSASHQKNGQVMGNSNLVFDDQGKLLSVERGEIFLDGSYPSDPTVLDLVMNISTRTNATMQRVIGSSTTGVYGERGSVADPAGCRWSDCPMGQLIADAFLHRCEVVSRNIYAKTYLSKL